MALTDRLYEMAVFARVVERAGFSAAARDLGISAAAVSKAVARLEEHLGARLLNRTTRKLSPTEAGHAFLGYCQTVVAQAEEAEQHVGQLQSVPRGRLHIAAPLAFGLAQVAPRLPELRRLHPELAVDLDLREAAVDMIGGGYDLLIALGEPTDGALVSRRLSVSRMILVASLAYLEAHGVPREPEELARHACLTRLSVDGARWEFEGSARSQSVFVQGPVRANSEMALRDAVLAGLGIARMPSFLVAADLAAGRLKCLFAGWTPRAEGIYACYPHRRHLPAKVRAALDFFAAAWGPAPAWDAVLNDSQCQC